jgi:plasmid stabilization system protein ParE
MKRVILSEKAQREIDAIWLYWAERVSEAVATRQVDRIWAGLGVLHEQPQAGRSADEIANDFRVFSVGKYPIY